MTILNLAAQTSPQVLRSRHHSEGDPRTPLTDIPKVLALIRAHAMLHQRSREQEGNIIKATMDDYSAVYRLVSEPLSFGLKASVPDHILEVVNAVCEMSRIVQGPVSQAEVAEFLNRDQTVISRNIATAIKEGFVENKNPGQGRMHEYVPGKRRLPSRNILPTPEELEVAIADSQAGAAGSTRNDNVECLPSW